MNGAKQFVIGCFIGLWIAAIFFCSLSASVVIMAANAPAPVVARTEAVVREQAATPRPTLRPTIAPRPTATPAPSECYIEILITDWEIGASVYVVATGRDSRAFCNAGLVELSGLPTENGFTAYAEEVYSVPDYPVWCEDRVGNVSIQVIAEYEFIGDAFCDGFVGPTSYGG